MRDLRTRFRGIQVRKADGHDPDLYPSVVYIARGSKPSDEQAQTKGNKEAPASVWTYKFEIKRRADSVRRDPEENMLRTHTLIGSEIAKELRVPSRTTQCENQRHYFRGVLMREEW